MKTKDSPGVYFPPPILYLLIFLISVFFQRQIPLSTDFFNTELALIIGRIVVALAIFVLLPALILFFKTKNSLITFKEARSLQSKGIYSLTRNPMYLGLLLLYTGIAFLKGNLWTFILIPLLIVLIHYLVIIKEERYLSRAFGTSYETYKNRVRRWL